MAQKLTPEEKAASVLRRKAKKAGDWQRFCQRNRRVYGTLSGVDYKRLEQKAKQHGRSVWQQVWQQSLAYENARFLPSRDVEKKIDRLYRVLRGIANNINQIAHHTNFFRHFTRHADLLKQVKDLEEEVAAFVKKPWVVPAKRGKK